MLKLLKTTDVCTRNINKEKCKEKTNDLIFELESQIKMVKMSIHNLGKKSGINININSLNK